MRRYLLRTCLLTFALLLLGAGPPKRAKHSLQIYKAERRMEMWVGSERVRTFEVGLGGNPKGDKVRQGDSKTPEGTYYVAWKNPKSSFHLFLGLSYPMPRHAKAAVKAGRITKRVARKIASRVKKRGIPPQLTPLGGYVGIHGGGAGADWTLGCIAVTNAEIEWIYRRMRHGDEIVVHP